MYSRIYQEELNIDWFCFINEYPIYVCSNGHPLPQNFNSIREIENACNVVNDMPFHYDANVNDDFVKNIKDFEYLSEKEVADYAETKLPPWLNQYRYSLSQKLFLWTFLEASKRGFFSFWWDDENNLFRKISTPSILRNEFLPWSRNFNRYSVNGSFSPLVFDGKNDLVSFIENQCIQIWPLEDNRF